MMKCYHDWMTTGIENQVTCNICGAQGTVAVEASPSSHLELARQALDKNLLMERAAKGSGGEVDPLHRAVYEIVRHLEQETHEGRSLTETIDQLTEAQQKGRWSMDFEKAEERAHANWVEWATATAKRCREYGEILLGAGIPDDLTSRLVEECHRALLADYYAVKIEMRKEPK